MATTIPRKLKRWSTAISVFALVSLLILWTDSYSHVRRLLIPIPIGEAPYGFLSKTGVLQFIEYDFWEDESRRDFVQFTMPYWLLTLVPLACVTYLVLKRRKKAPEP
jgi:uncharacterized membrane protein YozB (DUF420 family)